MPNLRELMRRDQDRQRLRELLLDGASSAPARHVDREYFDELRSQIQPGLSR